MSSLLDHLVEQSLSYTLLAVALVAFLESLVLVGLVLPGALMMAGLGALIGAGQLNLYQAWLAAIAGCLLADWISFGIGWRFNGVLHNNKWVNKYRIWLDKTEYALHKHRMLTILIGRFIGPTRPLVPMVAGMLNLSPIRFTLPSLIGALLWPPIYFLPGIFAGAAIDIPTHSHSASFKWLLLLMALLIWLTLWLFWRTWRTSRYPAFAGRLSVKNWSWLALLSVVVTLVALLAIQHHPLMAVYRHLLWQVVGSGF